MAIGACADPSEPELLKHVVNRKRSSKTTKLEEPKDDLLCYTKPKHLTVTSCGSLDGDIGKIKEFYFDDHHWTIRYLVADTGNWIPGRLVLISPYALVAVNDKEQNIAVDLTKQQIEDSPSLGQSISPSRGNSRRRTTDTMDGRVMASHTSGDLIPILYATEQSGKSPPTVRKSRIVICVALRMSVVTHPSHRWRDWPRRRFYHRRRDLGDSLSDHRYTELVAGEKVAALT